MSQTFVVRSKLSSSVALIAEAQKGVWDVLVIINVDAETAEEATELAKQWLEEQYEIYAVDQISSGGRRT